MLICIKCKEEMKCTKTGRPMVWKTNHIYRGDEYTCPKCETKIIYSNSQSYHMEKALVVLEKEDPLDMDKD